MAKKKDKEKDKEKKKKKHKKAKKKQSKKKKQPKACKHCEYETNEGYTRWGASDKFITAFAPIKKVKQIEVVACPKCAREWLLSRYGENNETVDLSKLRAESKADFDFWAENELYPTEKQLKSLAKIGGLNGDIYGNGKDYIDVPCKVRLKDGQEKDFCIVRFSKNMPEAVIDNQGFFWITAVAEITPSVYALPYDVRYESSQAQEQTNSYAPTLITAPYGKVYGLNWTNQFFATEKYTGAKFKLYKEPHEYLSNVPEDKLGHDAIAMDEITYIYADWLENTADTMLPKK
jgi:hypothetical protein